MKEITIWKGKKNEKEFSDPNNWPVGLDKLEFPGIF